MTMEEKKSKNNNKGDGGENEIKQRITVIQTETKKAILGFPRVESVVLHDEGNTNKQTVILEEHPSRFREAVENVQQASPLPKKEKKNDKKNKKNGDGGCGGGERKTKKDAKDKPKENLEQKKSNELVQPHVATAMLKVHSHCSCEGCTKKIQKVVTKTIGYHQMAIDGANGQVAVKGSMDMNALAKSLERQLNRYVEIVPLSPPKEDEKKEKSGCDHKEKDGGERNSGGEGGLGGEKTKKSYGDEFAKYVNGDTKKPTVIGKVNPAELRPTVDQKKSKNNNKGDEGENEVKQRITVIRTETKKAIRGFPRVESVVLHDEGNTNKQTVIREEHPSRFREAVENVQQASPLPKKDKKNDKKKKNGDGGGERKTKKDAIDMPKEKLEQKKYNELQQPQLATAMLNVHSHCECDGCTDNIQKVVTKTIGYHQMAIDSANGQVIVKGSMDMNALAKSLERQLKRYVEIVPLSPQKEDEKKEKSGCDHKEKDGGDRNIGGEGGLDGEKTEKSYGDEFAKYVNGDTKKPTVIRKVNPSELRPTVDQKKCKKLRRVSPISPEEDKNKKKENGGGGEERKEKKTEAKAKPNEC